MNLHITQVGKETVAEALTGGAVIYTPQDAVDVLATAQYESSASCLMLYQKNVLPEFFELKTGLAGEILQKYMNYGMKLVIIGDIEGIESRSLSAFIRESNRGKQVAFMPDRAAALAHIAAW